MRRKTAALVLLIGVASAQLYLAPSAYAHACPGGDKNLIVLTDPVDPRQLFDENNNDRICSFKKTFRDDHVHKIPVP